MDLTLRTEITKINLHTSQSEELEEIYNKPTNIQINLEFS